MGRKRKLVYIQRRQTLLCVTTELAGDLYVLLSCAVFNKRTQRLLLAFVLRVTLPSASAVNLSLLRLFLCVIV